MFIHNENKRVKVFFVTKFLNKGRKIMQYSFCSFCSWLANNCFYAIVQLHRMIEDLQEASCSLPARKKKERESNLESVKYLYKVYPNSSLSQSCLTFYSFYKLTVFFLIMHIPINQPVDKLRIFIIWRLPECPTSGYSIRAQILKP